MDEPMQVSGVGRVEVARFPCGDSVITVWNENGDEPDEPYLRFDSLHTCENEEPDGRRGLPRAAWTVTSGDGTAVLSASALPPKEVVDFLLNDDEED